MRARAGRTLWLVAAAGLLAGCPKPPPLVKHHTYDVAPGMLELVSVAPFYPTPRLIRSVTPQGISAGTAAELMARFFTEALERKRIEVIPPSDLVIAFEGQGLPLPRLDAKSLAEMASRKFGATAVVLGEVTRYRERSGEALGTRDPASVGFSVTFYTAPDARRIWSARFDETQYSMTENVLRARQYPGRGTRWLTAAEFASWGADNVVASLPASMQ